MMMNAIKDMLYSPDTINILVFHSINNIQNPLFQHAAIIGSIVGKNLMFFVYFPLICVYAWHHGASVKTAGGERYAAYRENVKQLLISLVVSYVVYLIWVTGLKHLLHMPRPFAILPQGSMFITDRVKSMEEPFVSFPSGHSAFAMMMLVTLWPMLSKCGKTIGVLLVLYIGISRIALGVHFPSDVLGSFILSLVITALCNRFVWNFLHKPLPK